MSGTRITVPSGAFVDDAGKAVTEPVALTVREFHNPIETWLGGIPMVAAGDAVLRSAGMMEIRGTTSDGREVELAPGRSNWIGTAWRTTWAMRRGRSTRRPGFGPNGHCHASRPATYRPNSRGRSRPTAPRLPCASEPVRL